MKWRGEREATIRNKEFRAACVSYGVDIDKADKKGSGEVKGRKLSEIKHSGQHVFPMVSTWKG